MPTPRTPTKAPRHSTVPSPGKVTPRRPTAIPELRGKGRLTPDSNAIVREVLQNDEHYPTVTAKAAKLGVHRKTIDRLLARMHTGLTPVNVTPKSPPPRSRKAVRDTEKRVKIVKRLFEEDDRRTSTEIQALLAKEGVTASRSTVLRDLHDRLKLAFRTYRDVPAKADATKRLAFATSELAAYDKAVTATAKVTKAREGAKPKLHPYYIFTDETWCNATHRRKGKFVSEGDPRPENKVKERFVPKVNTYGILTEDRLLVYDMPEEGDGPRGGITKAQFAVCLKAWLSPQLAAIRKAAGKREIRWVMDGAGIHNDAYAWIKEKCKFKIVDWPAHSPDLSPIENVWALIKHRIGKVLQIYDMKDIKTSRAKISKKRDGVAGKITKKTLANYVNSFKKRLEICVERKGEHTGY